jgi:stage VI sporulation protein D
MKGGVALSQGNQSCLRFSLEESVWFQRGQEVEELLSISLDPNITIQEDDQYVTIRGSLDLTGEYKRPNGAAEGDGAWDSVQKWVQNVEERDEGICEFAHQFPVDITIPTYRVRNLNEIDVVIETFDYLLPERSCLKLSADLNISGLYGEQEVVEEQEELLEVVHRSSAEEDQDVETEDDSEYESFEVEARQEQSFFSEPVLAESSSYQPSTPEISFAAYRSEQQPSETNVEADGEMQIEVPEATNETEDVDLEEEVVSPEASPNILQNIKNKLTNKKSMSISEFLARKEDHNDAAKLKVCIVQNGESADMLAERYQVTVQQLLKVNHLELNQDVHEGQVLYIPQVFAKK